MRRASPFRFCPSTSNFLRDQIDSKGLEAVALLLAFTFMATPSGPNFLLLLFFFFFFESVLLVPTLRFDDFAMDFAQRNAAPALVEGFRVFMFGTVVFCSYGANFSDTVFFFFSKRKFDFNFL